MRSAADIREAARAGAARVADIEAARKLLAGATEVRNTEWEYACRWVEELTDAQLRQAAALKIPGDAGLAIHQERGRRRTLRAA